MNYLKSEEEIKLMKVAGMVLGQLCIILRENIFQGVNLLTLDKIANDFIIKNNCKPSFLNYQGFPKTICISVNSELIHGIPHDYKIKNGDLISIDLGCSFKGYHGDCAFSVVCGVPTAAQSKIMKATSEALSTTINMIKPGINLRNICRNIEKVIASYGYYSPTNYCGHGIGKNLHEDPIVPNNSEDAPDLILEENMTLAIEPMLLEHSPNTYVKNDNWTVVPENENTLSCHAEHTILVTKEGVTILTS